MRFFIPSANDSRQAEEVYRTIRDRVAASVGAVSDKRIYRLKYKDGGQANTAVVGVDRHGFGSEPVLAIFEGAGGEHYVCTQQTGEFKVNPHQIGSKEVIEVETFSAFG